MLIIILLFFTNSLSAQYFPFIKNNKLGYIDINGDIKIEAKLDTKVEYSLRSKGKNDYLLGLKFPDNCYFNDGFTVFQKDKWFWILFPYKSDYGLLDTNSNAIIFENIKKLYPINNKRIRFEYNDSKMPNGYDHNLGVLNLDKITNNFKFREIEIADVREIKNELNYSKYIYIGDLNYDRMLIYEYYSKDLTDIYFIDGSGKKVIDLPKAIYVGDFSNSLALVKEENSVYFIDVNGQKQFSNLTNIEDATSFNNNRAFIKRNDKFELIDNKGNIISDIKFDFVYPFVNNYAKVKIDNKYYLIDNSGAIVIDKKYQRFGEVYNSVLPVQVGNKWQLLNIKSNRLLFEEYEAIANFKDGLSLAWKDEQIFYINVESKVVFEAIDKRSYEKKIANLIDRLN